ncbi:MAG TPA: hypothetical protein VK158_04210 [Acidobacteriota bacterium]|nr:hypothetical protein [Acidobacteriota bacterium]
MDFQTAALVIIGIIVFFVVLGIIFRLAKFVFQILSLVLLALVIAIGIVSFFSLEPMLLPVQDMTLIVYDDDVAAYRYVDERLFAYDISPQDVFVLHTFKDNLSGLRSVAAQMKSFSQSDSVILLVEPCEVMTVSCVDKQLSVLHMASRLSKNEPISHVLVFRRSLWFKYFLSSIDWT